MSFDRVEYTIATMEEAPQLLVVEANGMATCESHSNMYSLTDPQIGTYQTTLAQDQMEELATALNQPPFGTLPDHWGKVAPAERYQRVRVVDGSKTQEKLVTARLPIDPHLQALLKLLDQITTKVKTHPLGSLRIKITRAELRGHLLGVVFSLSNSGTQPITIRRPADLLNAPDGGMAVQAWPDRKDVRADEVKHLKVNAIQSELPEASSPIEIQPEASRPYDIVSEVDLERVPYVVRVEYRSVKKDLDGRKLLYGELFSLPAKIAVVVAGSAR